MTTYVCEICGHKLERESSTLGVCPNCGRKDIEEEQINNNKIEKKKR